MASKKSTKSTKKQNIRFPDVAHGANAHAEDAQGRNPLHYLSPSLNMYGVDSQDVLRVTQILLEQGVDVNALDEKHETPLHVASSIGHLENIRVLLDHGAKADAENVDGQIPLHLVSRDANEENADVTRLLLRLGTDVNTRDSKEQATPLHFASFRGHFEIALALLDNGADVNARNADGQTPLHRVSLSPRLRFESESGYETANRLATLCDLHAKFGDHACVAGQWCKYPREECSGPDSTAHSVTK